MCSFPYRLTNQGHHNDQRGQYHNRKYVKPKQKDSCKIDSDFSDCFCNVFDSFCVHDKPSKNGFLGFVVSSVFKSVLQYVIILFRKSFIAFRYI